MRIILPGYEGSKKILSASSFLINKYLPGFDVEFLNYGEFDGKLYCGKFISMDEWQKGGRRKWAKYLRTYLREIDDELVILGSDDFFVTRMYNEEEYKKLLEEMKDNYVGMMTDFDDDKRLSRTQQYSIWRREFLIEVLTHAATSAWKFESVGSRYIRNSGKKITWRPIVNYDRCSAVSEKRTPGKVAVGECCKEDVEFLIKEGHLKRDELIFYHVRYKQRPKNYE